MNRADFEKLVERRRDIRSELSVIDKIITNNVTDRAAAEKAVSLWNAGQKQAIVGEVDEAGKKVFGNDTARDVELIIRQTNCQEFADLEAKVAECDRLIAEAKQEERIAKANLEEVSALIEYELSHAADEITEKINQINNTMGEACYNAAQIAVKNVMAKFTSQLLDEPLIKLAEPVEGKEDAFAD